MTAVDLLVISGASAVVLVAGSPLLMTYFLVYARGARRTEIYMDGRPGFDEYKARTAFFVPCSPRSAQ